RTVAIDVVEVPVLRPLIERRVFDVPARSVQLVDCLDGESAGAIADDGGAPRALFTRAGRAHLGPYHADLAAEGVQSFELIDVPGFDVLALVQIIPDAARGVAVHQSQSLFERLIGLLPHGD